MANGVLGTSGTRLVGRDAIRDWSRARVTLTVQTRHIVSDMRFIDCGNGRATGSAAHVFMHYGDARGPAVPAVAGEDTDEFVRTDAGW